MVLAGKPLQASSVSKLYEKYTLIGFRNKKTRSIGVIANDSNHAQAQALDISRALGLERFTLDYKQKSVEDPVSKLFLDLAYNNFSHSVCYEWKGSYTNNSPVLYAFGARLYLRNLILDYMDIRKDSVVKTKCNNKECVNPYHFLYKTDKASKLTGGDKRILLAFRCQGASVSQIAKALNVHRSTVYRNLNEHLHAGP